MSAAERARQIVLLGRRLTEIFEHERTALAERRPLALADFEDERARLAVLFQREAAALKRDAASLRALDRSTRAALAETVAGFQQALGAHAAQLDRMRAVTERLVKAVADEVAARRAPATGYGAGAQFPRGRKSAVTSIAVNAVA